MLKFRTKTNIYKKNEVADIENKKLKKDQINKKFKNLKKK